MSRVEVFEDTLELTCESVTIHPIEGHDPSSFEHYPLPRLSPSGRNGPVSLPIAILENAYLRLTFAPTLGGRLLSVFDRRTQSNLLWGGNALGLSPEWPRGAGLDVGIVPIVGRALGSLGPVDFAIREWEDGSASFIAHQLESADGWSWHGTWTLPSDSAAIRLDFRALNRTSGWNTSGIGLAIGGYGESWEDSGAFAVRDLDSGVSWLATSIVGAGFLPVAELESTSAYYVLPGTPVAPRQTVSFRIDLAPNSSPGRLVGLSSAAAAWIQGNRLVLQVNRPHRGSKLFLLTDTDQTLEMPLDLLPEHHPELDIRSVGGIRQILLRDADGIALLQCGAAPLEFKARAVSAGSVSILEPTRLWPDETISPTHRAAAWYEGALVALRDQDWDTALDRLDDALLYAGDDHICWWLRAVVERHAGIAESPSLTNAHYLAPLEPLLRIESFLRQPPGGSEPSAIIRSIGANGDALVEGAVRYIEASLDADAIRWIDEAIRHQDLVMLRYLAAWRLAMIAGKTAEAAIHVQAAERLPSDLPLPFRQIEIECIDWLTNRFPDSQRLQSLSKLCRAFLQISDQ